MRLDETVLDLGCFLNPPACLSFGPGGWGPGGVHHG